MSPHTEDQSNHTPPAVDGTLPPPTDSDQRPSPEDKNMSHQCTLSGIMNLKITLSLKLTWNDTERNQQYVFLEKNL